MKPHFILLVAGVYLSLGACSAPPNPGGGGAGGDDVWGGTSSSSGMSSGGNCAGLDLMTNPTNCGSCGNACGAGKVCAQGSCAAPPNNCPCPTESYCDLATNTCKFGCTVHDQCSKGRICDMVQRTCIPGCLDDSTCAANEICENQQCRVGCRDVDKCKTGYQYCDTSSFTCRNVCVKPADCGPDEECILSELPSGGLCRRRCTTDAECSSGLTCTLFTQEPKTPISVYHEFCAKPCSVAGCAASVDFFGQTGVCTCDPSGLCKTNGGKDKCFQTEQGYGL